MSNDTNRLLRYMYGELEDAEDLEHALVQRPALFEQWFAFHEVKAQLDAQPPARPDASVVNGLVDRAREAAQTNESANEPVAPPDRLHSHLQGDGVPQDGGNAWCTVTVSSEARRADRKAMKAGPNAAPSPSASAAAPAPRRSARVHRAMQAAPWGLALVLAVMLIMSGTPDPPDGTEADSLPMATTASAEVPAWDAPERRAALHRQAVMLNERTAMPEGLSRVASTTP